VFIVAKNKIAYNLSFEARIPRGLNKIAYNLSFEARIPRDLNKIAYNLGGHKPNLDSLVIQ
jgi:hypothetical protein